MWHFTLLNLEFTWENSCILPSGCVGVVAQGACFSYYLARGFVVTGKTVFGEGYMWRDLSFAAEIYIFISVVGFCVSDDVCRLFLLEI